MKYFFVSIQIVFLLMATAVSAQNTQVQVYGVHQAEAQLEKAIIFIQLSTIEASPYNGIEGQKLDEVEANFRKDLQSAGISEKQLKENPILNMRNSYGSYGYQKSLVFETSSEKEFKQLIQLNTMGVSFQDFKLQIKDISNAEEAEFFTKALADAKELAEKIAKQQQQKIGDLIQAEVVTYINKDDWDYTFIEQSTNTGNFELKYDYIVKAAYSFKQ